MVFINTLDEPCNLIVPIRHRQRIAIFTSRQTRKAARIVRDLPRKDTFAVLVPVNNLRDIAFEFVDDGSVREEFRMVAVHAEFAHVGINAAYTSTTTKANMLPLTPTT
jgi:hypothetical protein